MSTMQATQTASRATLATLIRLVDADPALDVARRREILSAIRTVAKVLKLEPT